jgi:hypothetical protein
VEDVELEIEGDGVDPTTAEPRAVWERGRAAAVV